MDALVCCNLGTQDRVDSGIPGRSPVSSWWEAQFLLKSWGSPCRNRCANTKFVNFTPKPRGVSWSNVDVTHIFQTGGEKPPASHRPCITQRSNRKICNQGDGAASRIAKSKGGSRSQLDTPPFGRMTFYSWNSKQNAMGSLHNIDFGVFWASWGGSGKEPGSVILSNLWDMNLLSQVVFFLLLLLLLLLLGNPSALSTIQPLTVRDETHAQKFPTA